MVPPRYHSRRKKRSRRQEVEVDPATVQPIDNLNARAPPTEPLPNFLLEMDMSAAMSGDPRHALREPAKHGAAPSFRGIHDGEATSRFDQVAVDAI